MTNPAMLGQWRGSRPSSGRVNASLNVFNLIMIMFMVFPAGGSAAAPVAMKTSYKWNLAGELIMERPSGSSIADWFSNIDNKTQYSCKC